jgi:hypothetical protein
MIRNKWTIRSADNIIIDIQELFMWSLQYKVKPYKIRCFMYYEEFFFLTIAQIHTALPCKQLAYFTFLLPVYFFLSSFHKFLYHPYHQTVFVVDFGIPLYHPSVVFFFSSSIELWHVCKTGIRILHMVTHVGKLRGTSCWKVPVFIHWRL